MTSKSYLEGSRRPSRPSRYIIGDGQDVAESTTTLPNAYNLVKAWDPTDLFGLRPMPPGNAGLQPYCVTNAEGPRAFLKVCIVDVENAAPSRRQRQAVMAEAERATWAGTRGLGPRVLGLDASRGGFLTDWQQSAPITIDDACLPLRSALVAKMRDLHQMSPCDLPADGDVHWLHQKSSAALFCDTTLDLSAGQKDKIIKMAAGVDLLIQRSAFKPTPIHDDLHHRNILRDGDGVTFIDWNNLKLGDPMTDLGHFACFVDVPAVDLPDLISLWDNKGIETKEPGQLGVGDRLALHTAYFDLKTMFYFGQQKGDLAPYMLHRVVEDQKILAPLFAKELGLRL